MLSIKLSCIGFGHMSGAVVRAAVARGVVAADHVTVSSPSINAGLKKTEFNHAPNNLTAIKDTDVILLGAKPKDMPSVCSEIAVMVEQAENNPLVLSMAAGFNVAKYFNTAAVVSVMPNMGVSVNEGFTACFPNQPLSATHHEVVSNIFGSTGSVEWVNTEEAFRLYTALTGSGPGLVFRLMDAAIKAAEANGIEHEKARHAVVKTFLASACMADETGLDMDALMAKIASKGGTTQAGIDCLDRGGIDDAYNQAIDAAFQRAIELGSPDTAAGDPPIKKHERGIVRPRFFSSRTAMTSDEAPYQGLTNPL
ncbi:MAG: pyrroline-5-carboxylate reductase dimerization domain-containing protein [Legionellaceae bacterium]|nr:pyrroline-5-carboxylate reductase dimerization domain-containing protein [Legionellaceae bacterium]